ncbi:hypothetical protein HY224_03090 [Candidatus Uhrbacteria bacterium]|nr:hypothetical protein [Candidatus Uhrbacteria bacterium]
MPADGDYRVVTLGYKALPVLVKRYPAKNDFRTNFQLTRNWQALKVKNYPYLKNLAEKSARVMRREFSAIDIRFKDGQALILEVNRRPGFDGFEQATGLNVAALFLKYAAAKWRQRKK